jgi:hypothetical protein
MERAAKEKLVAGVWALGTLAAFVALAAWSIFGVWGYEHGQRVAMSFVLLGGFTHVGALFAYGIFVGDEEDQTKPENNGNTRA